MIEPRRAIVRPRVEDGDGGTGPLEEVVADRLDAGAFGVVALVGPKYSGKHTALAHLAEVFAGDERLVLLDNELDLDDDGQAKLFAAVPGKLVMFASCDRERLFAGAQPLRLAAWGDDEWIEYLLATHRDRCASVLARLTRERAKPILGRATLLHRLVLDALAADDALGGVAAVLHGELRRRLDNAFSAVAIAAFGLVIGEAQDGSLRASARSHGKSTPETLAMLSLPLVQMLLAVEHLLDRLRTEDDLSMLRRKLPTSLIAATAERLPHEPVIVERLRRAADRHDCKVQAMAVSLLYAMGKTWRPADGAPARLDGAYLRGIDWTGIRPASLHIERADLSGADLSESELSGVLAWHSVLRGIDLHGAKLTDLHARAADLSGANLSGVRGRSCYFTSTSLRNAVLDGASLVAADFRRSDLRGASFRRADLKGCILRKTQLDGADFTGADLSSAVLRKLDLRHAEFAGADFHLARLEQCNLEGMVLPGARFAGALLCGAHLTASEMPYANFTDADLRETGLAEVEWERADLRNADLRGATFHMGSSRSGLVANPPASEGTRTGFYTDDYDEQGFKSPAEIRKANLCGADLRGARIDNVDFYLVDLRNALYTPDQELHFRRSGAILESRV